VTLLTPERPDVHLPTLDAVVFGRVFATKRAPHSPLEGLAAGADERATWKIGMVHGALAIPGVVERDEVLVTTEEIAASGLDYLALGHWHSAQQGRAGSTTYAYSGAPEPVAIDQDKAGNVLLVTLDRAGPTKTVAVEERRVGRTRFEALELDLAALGSQPVLVERLRTLADADLVLDVRLTGLRPDEVDVAPDEVEAELRSAFLRLRVRDRSVPPSPRARCRRPTRWPEPSSATSRPDRRARGRRRRRRGGRAARRPAPRPILLGGHEVTL
jgi:DNA repair exonuclease SbcCD nuclease subunit